MKEFLFIEVERYEISKGKRMWHVVTRSMYLTHSYEMLLTVLVYWKVNKQLYYNMINK